MIRTLLALLFGSYALVSAAQLPYGNEWIDHERRYWRFDVVENGMRRIDRATLLAAGFPAGTVDPRDLMLFSREKPVAIYVEGEADGSFDEADFIEFQVSKNDAWLDQLMYPSPTMAGNPYYSFVNDTIRYYLTWDDDPDVAKHHIVAQPTLDHTPYPVVPYYWGEVGLGRQGRYFLGPTGQYGASSGLYVEGEGWYDSNVTNLTTDSVDRQLTIAAPRKYTGPNPPDATIRATVVGTANPGGSLPDHHVKIVYGAAPGVLGADTIYSGFKVVHNVFQAPLANIAANTVVRFRVMRDLFAPGQIGSFLPTYADQQAIASASIRYAKMFHMDNDPQQVMELPDLDEDGFLHVDFSNLAGTPVIHAYGDTVRRVIPTAAGARWKALLKAHPDSALTKAIVFGQESVLPITSLTPVNGTGFFTDFLANEVNDAMLIVTHESLMSAAQAYANYREISIRNPYNTVLVDVDELYDQFGGGVPKHAFAIRRWCRYLLDSWATSPKALFLIGKSVQNVTVNQFVPGIRPDAAGAYQTCLVPTFGHPASDVAFTIGLRFDPTVVEIPVGRLSVYTPDEVLAYLAKVQALESQTPGVWMKNILHFAGGFDPGETGGFVNYLNGLKAVAVDTSFGGSVSTFRKSSSETFQSASADSVRTLIQEGVTLMTFLAHAYASSFDITIDDPVNYQWNGKHPLVIGNSCYIGNIHQNNRLSQGEGWVLAPNTGPIGFLATTELASAPYLMDYSNAFYRSFSRVNHGKGIGEHMKYAVNQVMQNSYNLNTLHTAHTFTLQGDPTIVLNSFDKPDYTVSDEDVYYDPSPVTADADTFQVKAVITNIGKAINGPVRVTLERSNPGLVAAEEYSTVIEDVYLRDTAYFNVPTRGQSGGQGINTMRVAVDLDPDEVDELENDTNNGTTSSLFITSGDLIPIYPYDFAIVPDPVQPLRASTGDPFAAPRVYLFQIDTTDLFNSPLLETTSITAPGGVVSWTPQNIYALNSQVDSTVFFWRCSIDSTGNGSFNWYERSFQYIPGKHGWGQAHYHQFKHNTYSNIVYDRPERDLDFFTGQRNIRAQVHDSVYSPYTEWSIDLEPQDYNGCGNVAGWHVAVVDPGTFEPWGTSYQGENPQNNFGNLNQNGVCGTRVRKFFTFLTNSAPQLAGMQNMLETAVDDGDHVLCYTWLYLDKAGMAANAPGLMPYLETIDPQLDFSVLTDSVAYIFYYRKGVPGSFRDTIATQLFPPGDPGFLQLSVWVDSPANQGTITTPVAGPATAWTKLYWNERSGGDPGDSTRIILRGITPNGTEFDLANVIAEGDSLPLDQLISAANYPTVRLRGHFFDNDQANAPDPSQLKRWQLLSAPVPECAIDPPSGFVQLQEELFEGQEARVAVAVHNVSLFDMDSLLMGAWVLDRNNQRHRVHYKLNAPLLAGTTLLDTIRFNTTGLGGPNTIIIEANPIDTVTGVFDQVEQYRFNNIAQLRFEVAGDDENPILDVTFDGMHILDGDIVSAKPEIEIRLDDENTVLLHDSPADTALFRVYLTRPGSAQERLFFRTGSGVENMQFLPATNTANEARIHYRPTFATDGVHTLTVMANDRSNNASGDRELKINFEVINRSTITEVLNYPNPFTTSTRFVFTVTGTEPPTYMKIQILTITGKVVREVSMAELGPMRVGRNMTEFEWDGTDSFGDRLARGVYLYRVIAQLHGEDIELRETSASSFFTKGMGKMYLLR
jgi:hypothetical protein